jgi:hypothetical protein
MNREPGGFSERGQSSGRAEEVRGDFVEVGSTEAWQLLSEAQQAYVESQIKGRGFSKQSLDRMVDDILAEYRRQNPVPARSEDINRAFQDMVNTVIAVTTGELPGGGTGSASGSVSSGVEEDADSGKTYGYRLYSCSGSRGYSIVVGPELHYTCHCVGWADGTPSITKVCELFYRGELPTLAACEKELAKCEAVARDLNAAEDKKGGD